MPFAIDRAILALYSPKGESAESVALMQRIDEWFLKHPFYGARQMVRHLRLEGVRIGRRRASRHVLAWRLSNTLDADFCVEALEEALTRHCQPEVSIPIRVASSPASPSPGACRRPVSVSR